MAKDPSASVIPRSLSPAVQVRYLVLMHNQMTQTLSSKVHDSHRLRVAVGKSVFDTILDMLDTAHLKIWHDDEN